MAQRGGKDFISRLADAGEEAIHKVADMPGASRLVDAMNLTKERLDDLTKRMRGVEALEKRVAALERRLDEVQGKKTTKAVAKTTAPEKPAVKRSTAAKKTT